MSTDCLPVTTPSAAPIAETVAVLAGEVDTIIEWLTGYDAGKLAAAIEADVDVETFIAEAPELNPSRNLITGVVCGVRVEEIEDPTMRELRYLDKLIDELARGKALPKILRSE